MSKSHAGHFLGILRARVAGLNYRDLHAKFPDAHKVSRDGKWVLSGGGPKTSGCVYTLTHIASRRSFQARTLSEAAALMEVQP